MMVPSLSQTRNDSVMEKEAVGLSDEEIRELTMPLGKPVESSLFPEIQSIRAGEIPVRPDLEPEAPQVPEMHIDLWPKGSRLPRWATGYMYGYNSQSGSLLYGYRANAGMGISQDLGRYWTINGGLNLNKYSVYCNTVSYNSSVTWHPNRYFSTTVFGNYTHSFLSSMNVGPSFQYGGYVTLQTDTELPFGIDAGARYIYDPLSGHWTAPIVQPFVKIGGAKLGIDFGPMIQEAILRANNKDHDNGPGLIPKPIKAMPTVAPRR